MHMKRMKWDCFKRSQKAQASASKQPRTAWSSFTKPTSKEGSHCLSCVGLRAGFDQSPIHKHSIEYDTVYAALSSGLHSWFKRKCIIIHDNAHIGSGPVVQLYYCNDLYIYIYINVKVNSRDYEVCQILSINRELKVQANNNGKFQVSLLISCLNTRSSSHVTTWKLENYPSTPSIHTILHSGVVDSPNWIELVTRMWIGICQPMNHRK